MWSSFPRTANRSSSSSPLQRTDNVNECFTPSSPSPVPSATPPSASPPAPPQVPHTPHSSPPEEQGQDHPARPQQPVSHPASHGVGSSLWSHPLRRHQHRRPGWFSRYRRRRMPRGGKTRKLMQWPMQSGKERWTQRQSRRCPASPCSSVQAARPGHPSRRPCSDLLALLGHFGHGPPARLVRASSAAHRRASPGGLLGTVPLRGGKPSWHG
jgi:hypothetical protein